MFRRLAILAAAMLAFSFPSAAAEKTKKAAAKPAMPTVLKNRTVLANTGAVLAATCVDSNGNPVSGVTGQPFTDPPTLTATGGNLSFNLDIKQFNVSVPTLNNNGDCVMQTFNLREYGVNSANYAFPGPTLILNKAANDGSHAGDSLTINLTNSMTPQPGEDAGCIQSGNPLCVCNSTNAPQCCSATNGVLPDCFHGNDVTNLHFHGLHVSPQSPQDYVLLELSPSGSSSQHPPHSSLGSTATGNFQYAVNPVPANQAPGTHWYHPHKHGATALQVGNGMAGALLVRGEFDAQLQSMFSVPLTEHVMVIQYVQDLNWINSSTVNPVPLVNGLFQPVLQMQAGEIQRWRFVGATMEGSAQISINFTGLTAVQIAEDGVQFSNTNYLCQPLMNASQVTPPCTLTPSTDLNFQLSPGNRADFLVQAPSQPGRYGLTFTVFGNTDLQGTRQPQRGARGKGKRQPTVENIKKVLKAFAPGASAPGLFTVQVNACTDHCSMTYPTAMPAMPSYLADIPANTNGAQNVQFRLDSTSGTPGSTGQQPQIFGIAVQGQDGGAIQQFDGSCANFTETLNRTETWTLSQNVNTFRGAPFHVFHIHTNPFQVVRNGTNTYPEPIWMDSITLPNNASGSDGFPTDSASTVMIRQQFEDYTGAYVLHCHFLGHEDRGMMMMVQTVCPNAPAYYGQTVSNGGPDNCTICGGNSTICQPALPLCGTTSAAKAKAKKH